MKILQQLGAVRALSIFAHIEYFSAIAKQTSAIRKIVISKSAMGGVLISSVLLLASPSLRAAVITLNNFGDMPAGATQLTFAGLVDGSSVTSHGGVTFSTTLGGVTASTFYVDGTSPWGNRTGPAESTSIINPYDGSKHVPVTITFGSPITHIGFDASNNPTDAMNLTLFLDGTPVGSQSYADPGTNAWTFYGVQSTSAFNSILIDPEDDANGFVILDNLTFAAVPVPPAILLFGSGLLGLIGMARRKKA